MTFHILETSNENYSNICTIPILDFILNIKSNLYAHICTDRDRIKR